MRFPLLLLAAVFLPAAPLAAAPADQLTCIFDRMMPEERAMIAFAAQSGDAQQSQAADLSQAKLTQYCQKEYGWTDTDAVNAGRYTVIRSIRELAREAARADKGNPELVDRVYAANRKTFLAAQDFAASDPKPVIEALAKAGYPTQPGQARDAALTYIFMHVVEDKLAEDFVAARLAP